MAISPGWPIGVVDARGYFRIVDRKKDMILVSGFNVYPNEVEDVVSACPGVLECAAVGIPDERTGEAVKLVVVKKDPQLTEAQVKAWCQDKLTGYKHPRVVEFHGQLQKQKAARRPPCSVSVPQADRSSRRRILPTGLRKTNPPRLA